MLPPRETRLLKTTAAALVVGVAGVGIAAVSMHAPPLAMAVATFGTNVAGGFGVETLKSLYRAAWFDRSGRPIDENHVIVRALRDAQLKALTTTRERFDHSRATEPDKARREQGAIFSELLSRYLKEEEALVPALTLNSLADPTPRTTMRCDAGSSNVRPRILPPAWPPATDPAPLWIRSGSPLRQRCSRRSPLTCSKTYRDHLFRWLPAEQTARTDGSPCSSALPHRRFTSAMRSKGLGRRAERGDPTPRPDRER